MDFGKAFTYIFDDSRWFEKTILPILVNLIPIVGSLVTMGYVQHTVQNVIAGKTEPLPELDFGENLSRGWRWFLASLVYSLPILVIVFLLTLLWVPFTMGDGTSDAATFLPIILGLVLFGFTLISSLVLALVLPVAQANVAIKETLRSAFDFSRILAMLKQNIGAWLLVLLGSVIGSIIAPLGSIAFGVGVLFTAFYAQLVSAHLLGQAYTHSQPSVSKQSV